MPWLENIRNKPRDEKIKLIWRITAVAAVILVALWISVGRYTTGADKNFDLFKTIGDGIKRIPVPKNANDTTPSIPNDSNNIH